VPAHPRALRAVLALFLVIAGTGIGAVVGVLSSVLGPASPSAAAAPGTVLFSENFRGNQVSAGTQNLLITNGTFTPCLTASTNLSELPIPGCPTSQPGGATGTLPDASGDGALRLTSNGGNSNGYILYNYQIPTADGFDVKYNAYQYDGDGADMITFFLTNGADSLTKIGPFGGAGGYDFGTGGDCPASDPAVGPNNECSGLPDGVIGIGLDAYGNFSAQFNDTDTGSSTSCDQAYNPGGTDAEEVAIRGPGYLNPAATIGGTPYPAGYYPETGEANGEYCLLGPLVNATMDNPSATARPLAGATGGVEVHLHLDPPDCASLYSTYPCSNAVSAAQPGSPEALVYLDNALVETVPEPAIMKSLPTVKFGWAASTGGSDEIHEINDVQVTTVVPVEPNLCMLANPNQVLQGVAITSGSATITTPSALPSDDVGSNLYGAGIPAGTTITAISGTTVTISNAATATSASSVVTISPLLPITRTIADASITSGSTTLTDPAASMSPGDVGDVVIGSGIPAGTTITADTSSTTETMSAAATATVASESVVLDEGSTLCGNTAAALPADLDTTAYTTFTGAVLATGSDETQTMSATINLPAGVQFDATEPPSGSGWACPTPGPGLSTDTCTYAPPGGDASAGVPLPPISIPVQQTIATAGTYDITVTISSPDNDSPSSYLTATQPVTWGGIATNVANVSITKTASVLSPADGSTDTYTITASNAGPQAAANVVVTDPLPQGVSYASSATSTGTATEAVVDGEPTVTWAVGSLADLASATLTITVQVATGEGSIINTATESQSSTTPDLTGNQQASVTITPGAVADVVLTKAVSNATPLDGSTVAYTITAENGGPDAALSTQVVDTLPSGLGLVQYGAPTSVSAVGVTNASSTITAAAGTFSAGEVGDYVIGAHVTTGTTITAVAGGGASATLSAAATGTAASETVTLVTPATAPTTADGDATSASASGNTVTWNIGTFAVGDSASIVLLAEVDGSNGGNPVVNTAVETQSAATPLPSGGDTTSASASITVTPAANVSITKTVSPTNPTVGTNVTYTLTATNNGPDSAAGVTLTDHLPAGITYVSSSTATGTASFTSPTLTWTVGTLTSGTTATLTMVATVTTAGAITNTVTETQTTANPSGVTNASATINSANVATVGVVKTASNLTPADGSQDTYTVTVTNHGPNSAAGVKVTDALPAGEGFVSNGAAPGGTTVTESNNVVTWTIGAMTNGTALQLTITVDVTVGSGSIVNTAVETQSATTPNSSGGTSASGSVTINPTPVANVTLTKTASDATPQVGAPDPSDETAYTITVAGNGPDTAQGVTVSDPLPAGVTYVSSGSPVSVTGSALTSGSTTLTAPAATFVAGDVGYPVSGANIPSGTIITAVASGTSATMSNAATATASEAVTIDEVNTAPSGTNICEAAGTVTWGATCSPSLTGFSLASGASQSIVVLVRVTSSSGTITNTATESQTTPNAAGATADAETASAAVTPKGTATVVITKTAATANPIDGSAETFTVNVVNNGPQAVQGLVVTDPIPSGLTYVAYGPATTVASVSITAGSTTLTGPGGSFVAGDVGDVVSGFGIPAGTTIAAVPSGTTATLSAAATQSMSSETVTLVDQVAPTTTDGSSTTVSEASVAGTPTVTWTLGTIANGDSASLEITVLVAANSGTITNIATETQSALTPNSSGQTSSSAGAAVSPVPGANVTIAKTGSTGTPGDGSNMTFTLSVVNNGPDSAGAVTVTDPLPAGLTYVSYGSPAGTPPTTADGIVTSVTEGLVGGVPTVTWTIPSLVAGDLASLLITVTVNTTSPLVNTATLSQTVPNSSGSTTDSESASFPLAPAPVANVSITKVSSVPGDGDVPHGTDVTYSLTVHNAGPDPAVGVSVSDPLPAGLSYVSSFTATGSISNLAGTVTWAVGALADGATATATITALVSDAAPLGNVTNTATETQTTENLTGTQIASASNDVVAAANVSITKIANPSTNTPHGTQITYTIGLSNAGPDAAAGVVVTDPLPAGTTFVSASTATGGLVTPSVGANGTVTWTVGGLVDGGSASATIVVLVADSASGTITNTATETQTTADPSGTQSASASNTVVAAANVSILKTVSNATPADGTDVTYTLAVSNAGPDAAAGVAVSDPLPAGLTCESDTASVGSISGCGATVTWTIGPLADGGSATATITVEVNANSGTITNTAFESQTTADPGGVQTSAASINPVPAANVSITKTASVLAPPDGTDVTYTLTVSNAGPDAAAGVSVSDALPFGTGFVSSATGTGSLANPSVGTDGTVTWTVGSLADGGSATATITVEVIANSGTITNTAVESQTTADPSGTQSASASIHPVPAANVSITKTVSDPTPADGTDVTYTLTLSNPGPDAAAGVSVSDALPAGLTCESDTASTGSISACGSTITWTVGALADGGSATATITVEVNANSGTITNTAVETQTTADPSGTQSASASITPAPAANVSITKTVSNPAPPDGTDVTYTLEVSNAGPDAAAGVSVSDSLPAGLTCESDTASVGSISGCGSTVTWTVGALADGATATATITVQVNANSGTITNTAVETQTTSDPSGTQSASVSIDPVPAANVSITKTVSNSAPADGTDVTYTLTLSNPGPDAAAGVSVSDPLPAGVTCVSDTASVGSISACGATITWTVGTLADGGSATATITVEVNADSGTIDNTATETQTTADPTGTQTASASTNPAPAANVSISKTVSNPTPVDGTDVTYTLTLHNAGPDAAAGVAVSDPLPAGLTCESDTAAVGSITACGSTITWTVGSLADGATVTATITVQVNVDTGAIINTATESQTTADPSGTQSASASINSGPAANVSITKTVSNPTPPDGTDVTYTLKVSNAGPDAAAGVVVSDPLPAGLSCVSDTASVGSISACGSTITWTVGGLADGASATATITVEVHADSGTITNTATESQTTADPTGTQTASAAVSPLPAANVSISKTVPNATPADGTDLTYTLKVSNAGPDTAAGVSVSDPLPAGLTCVSDTASVGSISGCGPTITWTVGSLANGATATATITVEVNADSGTITNTATETQTTADPTGVQTSSVPIQPTPAANVSISKTVSDATPADGSDVTYTLKLNNAGPDAAAGVAVSDPLPFGTTFVSSSTATGSLSNPAVGTNGTVTWTVGTLSDGSTATATIVVLVSDTASGTITNTATETQTTADPTGIQSSSVSISPPPAANVSIRKTVSDARPVDGTDDTYTVRVHNAGPSAASGVVVTDPLPTGLTYVSAKSAAGSVSEATLDGVQTISWKIGTLRDGRTVVLKIVVKVQAQSGRIVNTATETATTPNPKGTRQSSSASSSPQPAANVTIKKTVEDSKPFDGATDTYAVTATNAGPGAAKKVVITDAVPAGLAYVSATASSGSVAEAIVDGRPTVTWRLASLADGATATLRIVVTVDSSAGTITNTATETQATANPSGHPLSSVQIAPQPKGTPVPPAHTGEPWSAWLYWLVVGLMAAAGGCLLEIGRRRRKALLPARTTRSR